MCKAIRDLMDDSRMEGREEGREEGIGLGIEKAKMENARNLLGLLSDETISEKIGLPLAVIKQMHK